MVKTPQKPPSPFSMRFTREERQWLDQMAAGMPLGAFLRSLIFDETLLKKRRKSCKNPVKDHQVLARLQAELGQSRIANNLNQLAKAANSGSLEVSPETEKGHSRCLRGYQMDALHVDGSFGIAARRRAMILKGAQRGGAAQLARHLLKTEENEHVEIHELDGFIADDLHGALQEIYSVSRGTRCQQFMFSVSLNPPENESVPIEYFEKALNDIETELGLKGQPRAVIFHEKEGRRHCHAVWSRIDAQEMKAINLPYYKFKLRDVSKQLYFQYGWKMPRGFLDSRDKDPFSYSLAEWQQAKRLGEDPKDLQRMFQECWAVSDNKKAFEQALQGYGLYLAKGDRRGYVAVDYRGEVYSLSRWVKVKAKDLKQRLGDPESLPGTDKVKAHIARRMSEKLQSYIQETQDQFKNQVQPYIQKKRTLQNQHQNERSRLLQKQEERWQKESIQRSQRLPRGFKGIWFRITGKYQKIRDQNEMETEKCHIRDRNQKQALIERQLLQRQKLQEQIRPILREHKERILALRQDIARYMEMGDSGQKALDEKLSQMAREKPKNKDRGPGYDYEI